ncbi:beta-ketoacyl synthase N-terminal-like domain-containing protein [Leucobacter ruminantium]|uniref:Beta-ketoacyl-[acyl-carrier-protein] synthase family protein n=1 Tax=Leucobacter ruminantium TaxID=1289170 RepID=A0A939LX04_9MICO|nr:beta-ketoacyl-[acyl-carrier-protein] synthase family protein [Leucobacter ruminantium]
MSASRRAVITGVGAITPSGLSADAAWAAVRDGRSAIGVLEGDEFDPLAVHIGGRVRGFDVSSVLPTGLARRLSPVQHWAIAAADEALAQAGAAPPGGETPGAGATAAARLPWDPHRTAVIAASGSGPVDAQQRSTRALDARGPRAVPIGLAVYGAPDAAAALLSQRYGVTGPAQGVSATCASGAVGLGEALRRVRHGYADAVIVVGMEDCLNAVNLASNANLRSLAAGYESDPTAACRPFDRRRSGFVMSQGAAALVVESEESARDRGATALAELAGFGASSDAHHATAPHPEGRGAARAVRDCLEDAGTTPADVDHVNAHGTGTPAGDAAELLALEAALGERARRIPITATKSSTGHLLGAAGALEAIVSIMTLRTGLLPPTLNLEDPEFDGWDFVTGAARERPVDAVLSTSFGFGGHNGALLLRRASEDTPTTTPPRRRSDDDRP